MKKIIYIFILAATLIFYGCGEDFLEHDNLYEKLDADFYSNPDDIQSALTAAYSCLTTDNGRDDPIFLANLLSDDAFGGGGTDNTDFQDTDGFTNNLEDRYLDLWETMYKGIFRTNMIITRFDQAEYNDETEKNWHLGEAHFLRAYFYFNLARFFGSAPLITIPEPANLPKAPADDLYAQIATDLKLAIELMPSTSISQNPSSQLGRATKWAAEAFMARVFLFYTGYYNETELNLNDGGKVTKDDVIGWVDDCIANSGHDLIGDFRNLWPYAWVEEGYPYAENNNLDWIGDGPENIETVFAIKFAAYSQHGNLLHYSNQLVTFGAVRAQENLIPFAMGYGGAPCNPQLWESWDDNDIRKKGTIIDVTDCEEGIICTDYEWGAWSAQQETGFWQKKYVTIQVDTAGEVLMMYTVITGIPTNYQLGNLQDEVIIRFADVLLMGAELGSAKAQEYYDRVRTRVGLPTRSATLENIKEERRYELAFEGIRYFDLLRWHDAEEAFAKVINIPIKNDEVDGLYSASYRPETGGFLPIPESQIRLSEGVLEQNQGW
ncbi:MAG: RagB/SusD family nutrient uptake outer membrane protein [Bacteroidales bacterium]|nr:MAG: RagB/SusD family nutrient uptake outer membrane protein [Bacteroidales bacterium]